MEQMMIPPGMMLAMRPPFPGNPLDGMSRHKFLKAEDDQLRSLVERFGEKNWTLISSYMKRRTPRQCRERYKNYLSPAVSNRPWSAEEEVLLVEKVNQLGQKWAKIAAFFDGRSDVNVKNRWTAISQRNERVQKCAMAHDRKAAESPELDDRLFAADGLSEEWTWLQPSCAQYMNGDQF
jgi:hypothetical protein